MHTQPVPTSFQTRVEALCTKALTLREIAAEMDAPHERVRRAVDELVHVGRLKNLNPRGYVGAFVQPSCIGTDAAIIRLEQAWRMAA